MSWLAYQQLGTPLATLAYGQQIGHISQLEEQLLASEAEHEVVQAYLARAQEYEQRLHDVEPPWRASASVRASVSAVAGQQCRRGLIVAASRSWPPCRVTRPKRVSAGRARCTRTTSVPALWADCRATARPLRVIPMARRKSAKTLTTPGATSWR